MYQFTQYSLSNYIQFYNFRIIIAYGLNRLLPSTNTTFDTLEYLFLRTNVESNFDSTNLDLLRYDKENPKNALHLELQMRTCEEINRHMEERLNDYSEDEEGVETIIINDLFEQDYFVDEIYEIAKSIYPKNKFKEIKAQGSTFFVKKKKSKVRNLKTMNNPL